MPHDNILCGQSPDRPAVAGPGPITAPVPSVRALIVLAFLVLPVPYRPLSLSLLLSFLQWILYFCPLLAGCLDHPCSYQLTPG